MISDREGGAKEMAQATERVEACTICGYRLSGMLLDPHVLYAVIVVSGGDQPSDAPSLEDTIAILVAHDVTFDAEQADAATIEGDSDSTSQE